MSRSTDHRPVLLLGGLAVLLLAAACGGPGATSWRYGDSSLPLEAWVTAAQDSTGALVPTVSISIPYRSLVFHRQKETYGSTLQVTVTAMRGDMQAGGGVAAATVSLDALPEPRSERTLQVRAPIRVRGLEPVQLEVEARVVGTTRHWHRILLMTPGTLAAAPMIITGVTTELDVGRSDRLLLEAAADSLRLAVDLLRPREAPDWPAEGLLLVSEVSGPALDKVRRLRQPVASGTAVGDTLVFDHAWPAPRVPFGLVDLQVSLVWQTDGGPLELPWDPPLELVNLGVPLGDDQAWRRHLEWLEDRLDDGAVDSLCNLPAVARPATWSDLWRRFAAESPDTPEHLRRKHLLRIVAADERYGAFGRGSLSDRGRLLIRHGEPDQVEVYADSRTPGGVWEVWTYPERHLRFRFHDAHGMGDFRLRREERLPD